MTPAKFWVSLRSVSCYCSALEGWYLCISQRIHPRKHKKFWNTSGHAFHMFHGKCFFIKPKDVLGPILIFVGPPKPTQFHHSPEISVHFSILAGPTHPNDSNDSNCFLLGSPNGYVDAVTRPVQLMTNNGILRSSSGVLQPAPVIWRPKTTL